MLPALKREFALGAEFQYLALRYPQTLNTQMAQTAACNRHHSLDQQLCRWLLLSIDRPAGRELIMTQELIADMADVRREGVTEAAGKLQQAGLINYSRGKITVLDRPGLERRVCECYAVVKNEFERLLPYSMPARARCAACGNATALKAKLNEPGELVFLNAAGIFAAAKPL